MKRLFGTDGIRARAGEDGSLTPLFAKKLGFAAAKVLCRGGGSFIIGCDTRESSGALVSSVFEGLRLCGSYVYMIGDARLPVIPTPAVAYLCKRLGAFGVMITASHNPWYDNGIKFFSRDGGKLDEETEAEIEAAFWELPDPFISIQPTDSRIALQDATDIYVEHLRSSVSIAGIGNRDIFSASPSPSPTAKIAIDCANGATYRVAARIFGELAKKGGIDVDFIGISPSGRNINLECGSTDTARLSRFILNGGYDLGIAFDGDGDRCIFLDERGCTVDGDDVLAILATDMASRGLSNGARVVCTVMSNGGLSEYLRSLGIEPVLCDVGDKKVKECMDATGALLGGESSGHVIVNGLGETGDGILTALLVLSAYLSRTESGKTFSSFARLFERHAFVTESIPVSDEFKRYFKSLGREDYQVEAERIIVRASGTEPLIRISAEDKSEARARRAVEVIKAALRKKLDCFSSDKGDN